MHVIILFETIALKMKFIQKYISETKISDSDEIEISKGTTEVTLKRSYKHLLYIYLH